MDTILVMTKAFLYYIFFVYYRQILYGIVLVHVGSLHWHIFGTMALVTAIIGTIYL